MKYIRYIIIEDHTQVGQMGGICGVILEEGLWHMESTSFVTYLERPMTASTVILSRIKESWGMRGRLLYLFGVHIKGFDGKYRKFFSHCQHDDDEESQFDNNKKTVIDHESQGYVK